MKIIDLHHDLHEDHRYIVFFILNFLPLFLIVNTQIKYSLRKGQLLFDFIVQLSKDKGLSGLVGFLKEV